MSDLGTMIWKEIRDEIMQGGRQAFIRPLLIVGIMGLLLPLQLGLQWLAFSPAVILISVYVSFFFIINYIGDAIAGERERHTLETLLASRISDQAILLGKIIVAVGYTWVIVLISLLVGALAVNLTQAAGAWQFYAPLSALVYTLVLSLLTALLAASSGVLVSLHSPTVRQAQQTLLLSTLGFGVVLYFVARVLPTSVLASLNSNQVLLAILVILVLLDAILLGISLASFKRSRLILS
jgi:ABC-2 type transport system permease protein